MKALKNRYVVSLLLIFIIFLSGCVSLMFPEREITCNPGQDPSRVVIECYQNNSLYHLTKGRFIDALFDCAGIDSSLNANMQREIKEDDYWYDLKRAECFYNLARYHIRLYGPDKTTISSGRGVVITFDPKSYCEQIELSVTVLQKQGNDIKDKMEKMELIKEECLKEIQREKEKREKREKYRQNCIFLYLLPLLAVATFLNQNP